MRRILVLGLMFTVLAIVGTALHAETQVAIANPDAPIEADLLVDAFLDHGSVSTEAIAATICPVPEFSCNGKPQGFQCGGEGWACHCKVSSPTRGACVLTP